MTVATVAFARASVDEARVETQRGRVRLTPRRLALLLILALQAGLSLSLNNTAFTDEALYLYAGRLELAHFLHGTPVYGNFASYFSGSPLIYPPIGAFVDSLGGLAAARGLSLVFMLVATCCVYRMSSRLVEDRAALLGTFAFAVTGPTLFLGHFATYDPMAVCLLAIAGALAAEPPARRPLGDGVRLFLIGSLLALAGMTKYAAFLFIPTTLGVVYLSPAPMFGRGQRFVRTLGAVMGVGIGALILFKLLGPSLLQGLKATTTNRAKGANSVRQVLVASVEYVGPLMALAVMGCALEHRRGRRLLSIGLAGTVFLATLYQAHLHTLISLQKHVDYGAVFAAPIAGVCLSRLMEWSRRLLVVAVLDVGMLLGLFASGVAVSQSLFNGWANSTQLVAIVESQFRPDTGRYLVEDSNIPQYYLEHISEPFQWYSTYFFQFQPKGAPKPLSGLPAYDAAFKQGYFNLVVLTFTVTSSLDVKLMAALEASPNYHLMAETSFGYGSKIFAWRLSSSG